MDLIYILALILVDLRFFEVMLLLGQFNMFDSSYIMFRKEQIADMAREEESGSPGWGASFFMQTTEDVARAVAAAMNSPRPSVIYSSKDDHGGSQLQRLQYQVTKMIKGFSRPPEVKYTNYNPEILTSQKRQWAANFQLQYMVNFLLLFLLYTIKELKLLVNVGLLAFGFECSLFFALSFSSFALLL